MVESSTVALNPLSGALTSAAKRTATAAASSLLCTL